MMSASMAISNLNEITETVWSMVLGMQLSRVASGRGHLGSELFFLGRVSISGHWQGAVTLWCSSALARRAAAAMFGKEVADAEDGEVRDALGELTNIVGGNFKTLLKGECSLSVPNVMDGVPLGELTADPAKNGWFDCDGGTLVVNVEFQEAAP